MIKIFITVRYVIKIFNEAQHSQTNRVIHDTVFLSAAGHD